MEKDRGRRTDSACRLIKAAPETIYEAIMDPVSLVQWLPPEGMQGEVSLYEPYIGGSFRITLTYLLDHVVEGKTGPNKDVAEGIFLDLVPHERIVQRIIFDSQDPDFSGEMIETWLMKETPHGTEVSVICENVPVGIRKEDHDAGLQSTLLNLAEFTEGTASPED